MTTTAAPDFELVEREARDGLADLRVRRSLLSLDALAGDTTARAELAEVEARIAELEREVERSGLARDEQDRREAEAAEAARLAEAERLEAELAKLTGRRDEAIAEALIAARRLGDLVAAVLDVDVSVHGVAARLGRPTPLIRDALADRVAVELQDAGLVIEAKVLAARRARLLERWPGPEAAEEAPGRVATCATCAHPDVVEVEAALSAGESLRDVGARFGLSRSSLSRHKSHSGTAAP